MIRHLAVLFVALGLTWCGSIAAHDSPADVIADLDGLMERHGPSAKLLVRRAGELRVLGRNSEAAQDLEEALDLDPGSVSALLALPEIYAQMNDFRATINAATHALEKAASWPDAYRAQLLRVRSGAHYQASNLDAALADLNTAIELQPDHTDAHLQRSEVMFELGRLDERARLMSRAKATHATGVLERAWIDAEIDAGNGQRVLHLIESRIERARLKSTWLIRRARIQMEDRPKLTREDLEAAVSEIDHRLDRTRPDLTLLAELAIAQSLLGNSAAAEQILVELEAASGDPRLIRRVTHWGRFSDL